MEEYKDTRERVIRLEVRQEMLESRQDAFEEQVITRLDKIEQKQESEFAAIRTDIGALKDVLTMGRGGYRALMFIGSAMLAIIGAFVWINDQFHIIRIMKNGG